MFFSKFNTALLLASIANGLPVFQNYGSGHSHNSAGSNSNQIVTVTVTVQADSNYATVTEEYYADGETSSSDDYSYAYQPFSSSAETTTFSLTSSSYESTDSSPVVLYAAAEDTTSTETSAATSTSSSSGAQYTGKATYYTPGADHCGSTSTSSDYVVAISENLYNSNNLSNEGVSGYCGKSITAHYNGKSVTAKIVDSCASCDDTHIDFSPVAFQQLDNLDIGVLQITWSFD